MKKYFVIWTAFILVLITASTIWFSYNHTASIRRNLKTILNVIKLSEINMDYNVFVSKIGEEEPNLRVTIIAEDGRVLCDNFADASEMQNHSNRPEFLRAQKNGYGEDIRKSETTNVRSIYAITKLPEGYYIRLAQPVSLTRDFLLWLFIPILFFCFTIAIFLFLFIRNKKMELLRSEFVANVSHELKTPLTSIKGFAELISSGMINDITRIKEYQNTIIAQSDRLIFMIDDILKLSKLEHTKAKEIVDVDLLLTAQQVMKNLKRFADEKNIIIQITGKGTIRAENTPIFELVNNLVENSIKYGKNGGYVNIILEKSKIIVKDDGIGISKQDQERVFERFYRADKSRSNLIQGTGLGLAIVKHTAVKYGGEITLISDIGNGTEIRIDFAREKRR